MDLLLAFAPFIAFAVAISISGSQMALIVGAVASAAVVLHGRLQGKTPKILEVGSLILFLGLAGVESIANVDLSLIAAKFWVDLGLLLIVVISIVIGRPFTIQYAKDSVPPAFWDSPEFIKKNVVISAVWALAFLAMVLAELAMMLWPALPHRLPVIVIVLALVGAFKFTAYYRKVGTPVSASEG